MDPRGVQLPQAPTGCFAKAAALAKVWAQKPGGFFFMDDGMTFGYSTLPETNSLHLKMDGWNTILSFWDGPFSGAMLVSGMVTEDIKIHFC